MRSLLFVPGDSERKLQKSLQSGADALIVDLEDSVVPSGKPAARGMVADFFAGLGDRGALPPLYIRVNDLTSGFAEADLDAVVPLGPDGLMLPKVRGGEDVRAVSEMVDERERAAGLAPGSISLLAIATETPIAVLSMASFKDSGPRLKGLAWGGEDLATAVGALTNRDADGNYTAPLQLARSL
ncbi:MAG: HpcH/HpaI aldolase/citrate lyase family protein, partial [Methyloligellaceae bacterium]